MARSQSRPGEDRRRFTDDVGEISTLLGPETEVDGVLSGSGNLELRGRFQGDMVVEGLVWIRQGGRFQGTLTATTVLVEGEIEGIIKATDKVDLRATSRVQADITAARVAAAEGSFLEGIVAMSGPTTRREVVTYEEKRTSPEKETPE